MLEMEDCPPTGGAGWYALNPVKVSDVLDVMAMRRDEDANGHDRAYWATQIMRVSSFGEMPIFVAIELMQAIASNNCVALKRSRDYLLKAIEDAIDGRVL